MHNKKNIIFLFIIILSLTCLNNLISLKFYQNYSQKTDEKIMTLVGNVLNKEALIEINDTNMSKGQNFLNQNEILKNELLNDKQNLKNNIILINIIITILNTLIFVIIFIYYIRKQNKKYDELNEYLNDILNGNYTLKLRDYEEGNLSLLKNNIYKITVKLKEQTSLAVKEKQELENILSDISHQIKTPLTSLYVINDILSSNNVSKREKQDFLKKNKLGLEKIEWLVTSLLKLSRLENGFIKLNIDKVNTNDLINKSLESLLIPIELKKQKLVLNIDDFFLNIDINWTVEAISNIIKNAYEHTNEGGTIKIVAQDNPIYSEIKIEDNGSGISKKDLPHIFERFYKASNQKGSIGIGLNMAKKIIELENGMIEVESRINKYTIFVVKFYKNII